MFFVLGNRSAQCKVGFDQVFVPLRLNIQMPYSPSHLNNAGGILFFFFFLEMFRFWFLKSCLDLLCWDIVVVCLSIESWNALG